MSQAVEAGTPAAAPPPEAPKSESPVKTPSTKATLQERLQAKAATVVTKGKPAPANDVDARKAPASPAADPRLTALVTAAVPASSTPSHNGTN